MNYRWLLIIVVVLLVCYILRRPLVGKAGEDDTFYRFARLLPMVIKPNDTFVHEGPVIIPELGHLMDTGVELPRYFKYREKLLVPIRSQGKCASCWAFAISDMMADRVSLYTGGQIRDNLSVQEFVSCFRPRQFPCTLGGIPEVAIYYPICIGLLKEKDYPYEQHANRVITPCELSDDERPGVFTYVSPSPTRHEDNPHRIYGNVGTNHNLCTTTDGDEDVRQKNILNMKKEIFMNGPIVGTMMVYDDLYQYDAESVYTVSPTAKVRGGHAIEIFGWADAGANTDEAGFQGAYWICRNSWGQQWPKRIGEKYGWFYIRMGTNECGIEDRASSCEPLFTPQMQQFHKQPGSSRDMIAYASYNAYVSDPERANFFDYLKRRRTTKT